MIKSKVFFKYIITYILVLLVPILAISTMVYTRIITTLKQEIIESTSRVLLQANENMDRVIGDLENICSNIPLNSKLSPIIFKDGSEDLKMYPLYEGMLELSKYTVSNSNIEDIFILKKDADLVLSNRSKYTFHDFFSRVYDDNKSSEDSPEDAILYDRQSNLLGNQMVIKNGEPYEAITHISHMQGYSAESSAVIAITMKTSVMIQMFREALGQYNGNLYVFDAKNEIVMKSGLNGELLDSSDDLEQSACDLVMSCEQNGRMTDELESDEMFYSYVKSDSTNWKYITVLPTKEVLNKVKNIRIIYILLIVAVCLIGIALSVFFSMSNYRKIKKITDILLTDKNDLASKKYEEKHCYKNEWGIISNAIKEYISQNNALQEKLSLQLRTINVFYLRRFIRGDLTNEEEIKPLIDFIKYDIQYSSFFVLLVRMKNNIPECADPYVQSIGQYAEQVTNQEKMMECTVEMGKGEVVIILASTESLDSKDGYQLVKKLCTELHSKIESEANIVSCITFSDPYNSLMNIPQAYTDAGRIMEYIIIRGDIPIMGSYDLQTQFLQQQYPCSFHQESQIMSALRQGNFLLIEKQITEIFEQIKIRPTSMENEKCMFFDMINTAVKAAAELKLTIDTQEWVKTLLSNQTMGEMVDQILIFYREMCELINAKKNLKKDHLKQDVMQYVNMNYQDSNISIEMLSEIFHVSPSYMSRFITEQFGINFVDYLHHIRLEQAKSLLAKTEKNISEIALQTGYNSLYNFTRVFKRYERVTPTEYRRSMLGTKN